VVSGEDSIMAALCKKRKAGKNPLNTDELNSLLCGWGHSVILQVMDGQFLFPTVLTLRNMRFRPHFILAEQARYVNC